MGRRSRTTQGRIEIEVGTHGFPELCCRHVSENSDVRHVRDRRHCLISRSVGVRATVLHPARMSAPRIQPDQRARREAAYLAERAASGRSASRVLLGVLMLLVLPRLNQRHTAQAAVLLDFCLRARIYATGPQACCRPRIGRRAIIAEKMLQAVVAAEAYSIDQHDLAITVSIGVSIYPEDGTDAAMLLKNADTAMYQAKENGRQCYRFFEPPMDLRVVARRPIEEDLPLTS
jgi:GGDEF domain-containing protein